MIKYDGIVEDGKSLQGGQRAKYFIRGEILSTSNSNSLEINGSDLIPIDWGGRLVTEPISSVNELGKRLLKAAADGNLEEIKNLLTKGAPFTADWLGTSPLHLAAQSNHLEVTELLLRAGISKDARTKVDRTALHMAAYEGHLQIVDALLKHDADIECKDLLGMTPLHWAVQNGHLDIVEYLLQNGADPNATSKFDLTPVLIAQQIEREDLENLLDESIASSAIAAQNLIIQLSAGDVKNGIDSNELSSEMGIVDEQESMIIPIGPDIFEQFQTKNDEVEEETIVNGNGHYEADDPDNIETENEQLVEAVSVDPTNFTDSLKLLQEHGIMLQNDEQEETNILNSVMESGHSVVLTDVGKQVLNSVKQTEQQQQQQQQGVFEMEKKIVTVTAEEFLAMANGTINKNFLKQCKVLPPKGQVKRITMKKNRMTPVSSVINIPDEQKDPTPLVTLEKSSRTDVELIMSQLIEARKTIEEYKVKLQKKEQEAERYKMQLRLFMDTS